MVEIAGSQQRVIETSLSAELWKNGHSLVKEVASIGDIEKYRSAISETVIGLSYSAGPLEDRTTYDKAFLQVTNLWQKNEVVKEFVFEKKFAQIAADLLGVEKVRLYHDQALFKEPGGGHTPWHQDKFYWPLDTDKMITMWMPLVDIGKDMGLVRFASGSHRDGPVANVEISDESEKIFSRYVSEKGFRIEGPTEMNAGDATFHLGWTIHSAGPNLSDRMREAMTIIYFADGAKVTEPASVHQAGDLDAWLLGLKPGDLACSHLNPILN